MIYLANLKILILKDAGYDVKAYEALEREGKG